MNDEEWTPHEEQRPKRAKRNVVLQKNVTPPHETKKFEHAGAPNDFEARVAFTRSFRDDLHLVTGCHKFARQQLRYRFNPASTREKMVRAEKDFHARSHAPTNSRKDGRERILPARNLRKTPS